MAEPTLLGETIHPAWNSLTPEERTCWHFWAATHPQYDEKGQLRTMYGAQAHYAVNREIAVTLDNPLLHNPPSNSDPPIQVAIISVAWPLKSRIEDAFTEVGGLVWLELKDEMPENQAGIIKQGYRRSARPTGRKERTRHCTIVVPLHTGIQGLGIPSGYFATTEGENRYARIKGRTAQRRPDKPLGIIRIVNLHNGQTVAQVLRNPYVGARRGTNRARATAVSPDSGVNHFP